MLQVCVLVSNFELEGCLHAKNGRFSVDDDAASGGFQQSCQPCHLIVEICSPHLVAVMM